uniref:Cullin family profile domain-containing protein n=1 Tax=Phaeomonas parva TaxID=124430 RepID=A0A7S1UFT6_9STRA|mmetsp:Transcript_45295/g.141996  ORF Transcript_45295/g.141996 Transcript_45295/m.141996 type:complete len:879 (+) Transcript_45295:127-2763(+)
MSEFLGGAEDGPDLDERLERSRQLADFAERVRKGDLDDAPDNVDAGWEVIRRLGIDVVVEMLMDRDGRAVPFGHRDNMNLHLIAYEMAQGFDRQGHAGARRLYEGFATVLNDFLDDQLAEARSAAYDLSALGEYVYRWWDRYRTLVMWLYKVLGHLDSGYVEKERLESLTTVALRKFHRKIYSAEMGEKVTRMLIDQLNLERDGGDVDGHFLTKCIELFVDMGAALNQKSIKSIRSLRATVDDLGEYERNFQRPFLAASAQYWRLQAQIWLDACDAPAFLRHAERAILEERSRARRYLHSSSEILLLDVVRRELLFRCGEAVLNDAGSGSRVLLARGDLTSLRRAYHLFREVEPCLALLARHVQEWVTEAGMSVLRRSGAESAAEKGDDGGFVRELLELHASHMELLHSTFEDDPALERSVKLAYTQVVNADAGSILAAEKSNDRGGAEEKSDAKAEEKSGGIGGGGSGRTTKTSSGRVKNKGPKQSTNEVLVRYLDRVLRGLERGLGEAAVERSLENIMGIFTYLTDKDFFLEVHRNLLCKRLLGLRSGASATVAGSRRGISEEVERERAVIAAMKLHMGTSFTSKVEGMVNDYLIGQSLQAEYRECVAEEGPADGGDAGEIKTAAGDTGPAYDFEVQMLTTGFWPSQEQLEPRLPAHIARRLAHFEGWYAGKHNHRVLKWIHALGEVEVKAFFPPRGSKGPPRTYTMTMSPFQALVLQHFDADPGQTFAVSALRDALGLDDHVVSRVLHGLCCRPKTRLLKKTGAANAVALGDEVCVNLGFSSKQVRFRVLQPALQRAAAQKVVKADRSHAIDATLVRTMKARKLLAHNELVQECLRQLTHFSPEARAIKLRIESLIERDYLERDPDDSKKYRYVP